MADDDSEPILGQWFEETLSPSESQSVDVPSPSSAAGASDVDGVGDKHARHHGSADSICVTSDKKEPDAVHMTALFTSVHTLLTAMPPAWDWNIRDAHRSIICD